MLSLKIRRRDGKERMKMPVGGKVNAAMGPVTKASVFCDNQKRLLIPGGAWMIWSGAILAMANHSNSRYSHLLK